ncbi:hypothetical protein [Moraxella pluranimalium]|uniref:hypothetical protein n=1 Tax=Moraxella pluranimalium TaxID=470453 RepID=UPI0009918F38|nr:hypothetical protein [Moraxella pluranimalium]
MSEQSYYERDREGVLENAKHSIQLGVEDCILSQDNPKRKTSAVRNIFAGLLLLYKYKLLMDSPVNQPYLYIYQINHNIFYTETFGVERPKKTVDVTGIKDVFRFLKININTDLLMCLNRTRNNLEHFYHTEQVDILKLIVDSFYLIKKFYEGYIYPINNLDLNNFLGQEIYQVLLENEQIYTEKREECSKSLECVEFPEEYLRNFLTDKMQCPYCLSSLIKYQSGEYPDIVLSCIYCNHHLSKEEVLGLTHQTVKDGEDFRRECMECGGYSIFIDGCVCLDCGFEMDSNRDYEREQYLQYLLEKAD